MSQSTTRRYAQDGLLFEITVHHWQDDYKKATVKRLNQDGTEPPRSDDEHTGWWIVRGDS